MSETTDRVEHRGHFVGNLGLGPTDPPIEIEVIIKFVLGIINLCLEEYTM
jgi:hypothetical protein